MSARIKSRIGPSESQPEIVITDVQIPVMSGLELISQMQEQNYPAKYLVLSGYAEFQYVQQALRLSVCNYLLKPPRIQELQEAMKKICDQILLERQLRSNEHLGDVLSEYRQIDFSSFLSKEAPSSETTSSDLSERSRASAESSDGQIQKTVEMLHEKIQTDFSNNIDINEFAKLHGYHPVYLITQFSKIYQISPTQFIKQLKMESAKKLLRTTEKISPDDSMHTYFTATFYFRRLITMTNYKLLNAQLFSLIHEIPHRTANLSNASALLYTSLPDLNWAGFYFIEEKTLALGPFQGRPACIEIALGKGVCGTAALQDQTLVVDNVHEFAGHIACDSASNSEIVIPLHKNGTVIGVLDIDSPLFSRFTPHDQAGLEAFAAVLEQELFS